MIPYFQYNAIMLGPIEIQVWGVFVSLGLIAGILLAHHLAKKFVLSQAVILDMSIWAIVGALIMARFFHVIFYEPSYYIQYPLDIFKFWHGGASSLGGFIGAGLAVWIFVKIRRFTLKEIIPYLDIGVVSLWLGWFIGRLGCFFIHDHTGKLSNFFLAVNFASGSRHDLGLYDSLLALVLFISYFFLFKKIIKIRWGLVAIMSALDYTIVRFLLDFLRENNTITGGDIRYFHLTPAQWGMIALFIPLTLLLIWSIKDVLKKRKK